MTDPLTYLDEVDARTAAATEGPWEFIGGKGGERRWAAGPLDHLGEDDFGYTSCALTRADAEFIAHARTDVPVLSKALRAVLELTARRWVCGVFSSGYHNGATCREDDPHAGWGCGFRHEFSVSDEEFRAITAALSAPNEGEKE